MWEVARSSDNASFSVAVYSGTDCYQRGRVYLERIIAVLFANIIFFFFSNVSWDTFGVFPLYNYVFILFPFFLFYFFCLNTTRKVYALIYLQVINPSHKAPAFSTATKLVLKHWSQRSQRFFPLPLISTGTTFLMK